MRDQVTKQRQSVGVAVAQKIASDVIEAGSTKLKIKATAHSALPNDLVRLTSGPNVGMEYHVISVETNYINLASLLPCSANAGDTFDVIRLSYSSSASGLPTVLPSVTASEITEHTITVTDVSGEAASANAARKGGFIQNIGANRVWVSTATPVVAGVGFELGVHMSIGFHGIIPGYLYTGALYVICDATKTSSLFRGEA